MADLSEWGIDATDNDVASPDGAQTSWVGADVGPWGRETMAAVARFYGEPAWVNPTRNGLDPIGNKTIARTSDTQIQVSTGGGSWGASTTATFAVGRLIRIKRTSEQWHYGFITASSTATSVLTIDLALVGTAALSAGWVFDTNGLELFGPQDVIDANRPTQPLGAVAFSGVGTTAQKTARFPDVTSMPEGVMFFDTDLSLIQVVVGTAGSRAWQSVAPLSSIWSDAGGKLSITSATDATVTLNAAANNDPALILNEDSTDRSRLIYDATALETSLEGGDWAAGTAGRIYIKDTDGLLYYEHTSGGTPGGGINLTPGFAPSNGRIRTGGLGATTIQNSYIEIAKGVMPAQVEAFLESSDWEELTIQMRLVITSTFSGSPSNGTYLFNLYLGEDYDTVAPGDLSTGATCTFTYAHATTNPYYANMDPTTLQTAGTASDSNVILNADFAGNINSWYISGAGSGLGNPQDFEVHASQSNHYSYWSIEDKSSVIS